MFDADDAPHAGPSEIFKQCLLTKDNWRTVAWLPAKAAKVGNAVTGGWQVAEVWGSIDAKLLRRAPHRLPK